MKKYFENLEKKISNKTAKVTVIGIGYVGLAVCKSLIKAGYHLIAYDIDPKKLKEIKNLGIHLSGPEYGHHEKKDFTNPEKERVNVHWPGFWDFNFEACFFS